MIKMQTLNFIYSEKGPYSIYRKKFIENKKKKNLRNVINNRKVLQVCSFLKDKKKSILDIACGDGSFLKVCQKYGFMNIQGIDTKYKTTITKNKINFYNSIQDLGSDKKFDLITLWGLLEHHNDPNKITKEILKLLNKRGFILLEVPNSESILMKHLISVKEKANRFLESGRHLYFFSKKFFELFAKKNKMSLIDYETNGLDLQTIIGPTNRNLTKKILDFQKTIDDDKSSDHLRVLLQKN
jgi:2-polyprenyl-3-methyl-5-hydroxy-6-metoxy-1,4-benzoquinol methylase